jgi:acetate kinase
MKEWNFMNILFLNPGLENLEYSLIKDEDTIALSGTVQSFRGSQEEMNPVRLILSRISAGGKLSPEYYYPDAAVIRVINGGAEFNKPVLYSGETLKKLTLLIPVSPVQIPAVIAVAGLCRQEFPDTPIILVFETAFFSNLPVREKNYAVSPDILEDLAVFRTGYHGILHEAACRYANSLKQKAGGGSPAAVLSICLDARPEAAAVIGGRPLYVTGGATPLEGLPGDNTCGDLDPGIIFEIANKLKWGPEKINKLLTRESGFTGITGKKTKLPELFQNDGKEYQKAREFFLYRLLLSCGAGISAIGKVDFIAFSGIYKETGKEIGPWLLSKLGFPAENSVKPDWFLLSDNLETAAADAARPLLIKNRKAR